MSKRDIETRAAKRITAEALLNAALTQINRMQSIGGYYSYDRSGWIRAMVYARQAAEAIRQGEEE